MNKKEEYTNAEAEQQELLERLKASEAKFVNEDDKILYEFSSARTMYDFSEKTAKNIIKHPQTIYLITVGFLLLAWVLFSLIYRLITEENKGAVMLGMVPSLILVAAVTAIVLITALGAWGEIARFALKRGLHSRGDAADIRRIEAMKREFERADKNKPNENAITVTENYFTVTLSGRSRTFDKDKVKVRVQKLDGDLVAFISVEGEIPFNIDFPERLPLEDFHKLKKALRERLSVIRVLPSSAEKERDGKGRRLYGGYRLGNVIVSFFMSCVILAAGVMLVVTHYLWVPGIPPFLGVFFALAAGLCFTNTFGHIPAVNVVVLPFIFSLTLLIVPPWIFVWYETTFAQNALTFWGVITHADVFPVGMMFFSAMGGMVLVFAVVKLIDFIRFGRSK